MGDYPMEHDNPKKNNIWDILILLLVGIGVLLIILDIANNLASEFAAQSIKLNSVVFKVLVETVI